MTERIRYFNMIEVLLALTVIAIGMTSILGLFPVGLNASRNAVAENCSSDIADQLITYFRVVNEMDQDGSNYNDNFATTGSGYIDETSNPTISTNTPTDADIATDSADFLEAYKDGNITAGNFARLSNGWAIFKSSKTGMYFVVQGPNCLENTGERPIDFSAMALVWKSPVQIKRWDGSAWNNWPSDADVASTDYAVKYKYSSKLNIELSWPLEQPYADRKKRYYQIVITKP